MDKRGKDMFSLACIHTLTTLVLFSFPWTFTLRISLLHAYNAYNTRISVNSLCIQTRSNGLKHIHTNTHKTKKHVHLDTHTRTRKHPLYTSTFVYYT